MNYRLFYSFIILLIFAPCSFGEVKWQPWSDSVFEQAQKSKKLVILDLEAIWCHWCHVMDKETYSNPEVQKLLDEKYIALKVDQDSRPDLSNRYEDYGWPATIIFNERGEEIRKESGFINPKDMVALLQGAVKDPKPNFADSSKDSYPTSAALPDDLKQKIIARHYESMDEDKGGLSVRNKFLYAGTVEYSLIQSTRNSERDRKFAILTLDNNLKLFDPAWGGVYQYSTHSDWDHPHFEKIMYTQTANMKSYALAYSLFNEKRFLDAALSIYKYIKRFLTDTTGAFYTSQDADLVKGNHSADYFLLNDAERIKQGIPKIDNNIYSRENGQVIEALASLHAVANSPDIVQSAQRAADWIEKNRKNSDGSYRHGESQDAGLFLGDTLWMGKAFLALYTVTADKEYLLKAKSALGAIDATFSDGEAPGFFTTKRVPKNPLKPVKNGDENIQLARFSNLMFRYAGDPAFKRIAESAMRYIATPSVALDYVTNAEVLIAAEEIASEPMHITVVGPKKDASSLALFKAGLSIPSTYKRIEWWDKSEGPLPNSDVSYPELPKPSAFLCTNKQCSLPIFRGEDLIKKVKEFGKR